MFKKKLKTKSLLFIYFYLVRFGIELKTTSNNKLFFQELETKINDIIIEYWGLDSSFYHLWEI
jgi:hypothetical protein